MKCKKLTALLLTAAMTASVLAGCGGDSAGDAGTSNTDGGSNEEAASGEDGNKDIIDFSMFIAMPGPEINDGNEIQEIIRILRKNRCWQNPIRFPAASM